MKKAYYKKLLIMYSTVFFILTLLFSSIYFINVSKVETTRVDEQNQILFLDYVKDEEEKLAGMIRSNNKIAALNSTMSYAISNGTNYYQKMSGVRDDLSMLGGTGTKFIYFVQKQNDSSCVTNYQSLPMKMQLEDFGMTEMQYLDITISFGKKDLQNYKFIYTDKGILYLTTKTINNSRVYIGVFTVYNQFKKYDDNSYVSFCVRDDVVDLRTLRMEAEDEKIVNRISTVMETSGGHWEDSYHYYAYDSQYNNNRYYFKTAYRYPTVFSSIMEYLPFVLITTAVGFFLILYVSKKMYAPIEKLVNIFIDMEDQEKKETVGDDIEYLATQVSRMRYENQDLTRRFKETQSQNRSRLISEIIRGTFDCTLISEELEQYQLEWLDGINYIVMVGGVVNDVDDSDKIAVGICSIVKEQLSEVFCVEAVNSRDRSYSYIVHAEILEHLEEVLSRLVAAISAAFGFEVVFYISKRGKSVEDIHYSFMTLDKVKENSLSMGKRAIYDFRDVKQARHPAVIYPVSIENKLLNSIEKGNGEEMDRILDYIFKEYVPNAFLKSQTRNMIVSAFANTANRCFERFSIVVVDVLEHGESVYGYLDICQNVKDFENQNRILFKGIFAAADSGRVRKEYELKPRIEVYMKENICSDISLISMADYFKLTPNYVSTIFKSVMGENFKDYTSRYRFELGVEYLNDNPYATLNQLAEKIGINSTATVIRLFKKYAGCSPSKYAEGIQAENKNSV